MKTFLDCIPCFMGQALRAGRAATSDEALLKELLDRVGCRIKDIPLDLTPPEIALMIYEDIREITGVDDPFSGAKKRHIEEALRIYPSMRERVLSSSDPLRTAVGIAIAGNVIDLGTGRHFDIENDIEAVIHHSFAIDDMDIFREKLAAADKVLYLGDNAGESVFDRLLVETLEKPVTYAVRSRPVINDVTLEDALASGLGEAARIVSSGSPAPAVVPRLCSPGFMRTFNESPMIISKGQGNYEGLSGTGRPVFFLLKAKCPVIARDIGVKENDLILKYALKGKG
jgi:uncharacterized protein with ATP-grasp and redox domains